MHRIYTKEQYFEKVALLRQIVPNVTLGTDIIVGFPTETEEEFQETYDVLKELRFSVAYLYSYSPRKGTPAIRWKDDIPEEVKQSRLQRLIELQESIGNELRQEMLGKSVEVLVEKYNKEGSLLKGRSRCWQKVAFPGDSSLIGTLQQVTIHSYSHQTLIGELTPRLALV